MKSKGIILIGACALFATGCTQMRSLTEPTRSAPSTDVAYLFKPRQIPYETITKGNLAVSYSLDFAAGLGYRLTLLLRNTGPDTNVVRPVIMLRDGSGLIIPPDDYQSFVEHAAVMANTTVPVVSINQPTNYYSYSTGTVHDTVTGRAYSYTGTTTTAPAGGFAGGFAQGYANAAAAGAAGRARREHQGGLLEMQWAQSFWLKNSYVIPPGSAVSGALILSRPNVGPLPMRLTVQLGDSLYEFTGASK